MKAWFAGLSNGKQYGLVLASIFAVIIIVAAAAGGSSESSTKTVTVSADARTVTVEGDAPPVKTVTVTKTKVRTVKTEAPATSDVADTSSSSSGGRSFSGNGGRTLKPFTIDEASTLKWTNDGDIFQVFDIDSGVAINASSSKGDTYLEPGTYKLDVNAIGNWTIKIVPA